MGEEHAVAEGLSGDHFGLKSQSSLSLIKQRVLSAAELMALPSGTALMHVKGIGFTLIDLYSQNQIAPFCDLLAENPLEGGRLTPDPQIRLVVPGERA